MIKTPFIHFDIGLVNLDIKAPLKIIQNYSDIVQSQTQKLGHKRAHRGLHSVLHRLVPRVDLGEGSFATTITIIGISRKKIIPMVTSKKNIENSR